MKTTDACPKWAEDLILKIRALEIQLGNVRPGMTNPGVDDWQSQKLEQLLAKVQGDDDDIRNAEAAVEALFRKVAKGLTEEGVAATDIALYINKRVAPESRLPYCSADEVKDALVAPLI